MLVQAGWRVGVAFAAAEAARAGGADRPVIVVVGLGANPLEGLAAIRSLLAASPDTRVLAHLSHVRIPEFRAAAREAGVRLLWAHSAITQRLPDVVRRLPPAEADIDEDAG